MTTESKILNAGNDHTRQDNGTSMSIVRGVDVSKSLTIDEVLHIGEVFASSGYFNDAKSAAQCVVKILRGAELGLGPVAAMENINVIQGRTALSYSLIGGLIKKSGRYDYREVEATDSACTIAFFEQGKEIGRSSFTTHDAAAAGLAGKEMWKKYPATMLFARAMSQGARRYTPDVFGGAIYTPEELQAIKEPELAIDTPVQTIDRTTGEITEPPKKKAPRPRAEMVQRYRELTIAAGQWNADESHQPIEYRLYSDAWTDDELKENGLQLAAALDQAEKGVAAS